MSDIIPMELVKFSDGKAHVQEDALSKVLLNVNAANRPLIVISVVGTYRRGKSFFLNFILRFLKAGGREGWMGGDDDILEGFNWLHGKDRVTTGIFVWPQVFVINEVAVLLIDTQGTQDNHTDLKENTAIMAISGLLSSVQIVNISQRFESQDFTNLEFFSSYGKLIQENSVQLGESTAENGQLKIFQKLMFLIRDWPYPDNHNYGNQGGLEYLTDFLRPKNGPVNSDFKSVEQMLNCFEKYECFLLPHPGDSVSNSRIFRGKLKEIEEEFKTELKVLVEGLFEPNNMMVKRIAGQVVTGRQFKNHVNAFVNTINAGVVPDPKTMFNILADEVASDLIAQSKKIYLEQMQKSKQTIDQNELQKLHKNCKRRALKHFNDGHKLGAAHHVETFKKMLEQQLEEEFKRIEERAESSRKYDELERALRKESESRERMQNQVVSLQRLIDEKTQQIANLNSSITNLNDKLEAVNAQALEFEHTKQQLIESINYERRQFAEQQQQNKMLVENIQRNERCIEQLEQKINDAPERNKRTSACTIL